jgi:hypothetical protein
MTVGLVLAVLAYVAVVAINFAKGKIGWGIAALLGVLWLFALGAAIRLARPSSWWAKQYYGPTKMAQAKERFPAEPTGVFEDTMEEQQKATRHERFPFECGVCGEAFEDRTEAENHVAHKHPDAAGAPAAAITRLGADG